MTFRVKILVPNVIKSGQLVQMVFGGTDIYEQDRICICFGK